MSSTSRLPLYRRFAAVLFVIFLVILPAYAFGQKNPRIAVIPFNPIGVSAQDSKVLTELLETGLVKTGAFQVIEQTQVKQIVEAQKYTLSGCTDESCAVELGHLLAADRIVLGSVSSMGGKYIINAKIINVESGENIKADNVQAGSLDEMTGKVELLAFKLAGLTYTKGAEVQIAKEFGEVFITTEPSGAEIYINGVKKGTSPELFSKVPLGTIKIEARKGNLYGEQETDISGGTGKISITLQEMFGNLFIKSSKQDVDVFLDGKRLGALGEGFFEKLPVGTFKLELKGEGLYWSGDVEITPNESTRVEAYPREYGSIRYDIPEGAQAEITGVQYRQVVRGSGTLEPVWAGKYTVTVSGDRYESEQLEVNVTKGRTSLLEPKLSFTRAYSAQQADKKIAEIMKLLGSGKRTTKKDIAKIEAIEAELNGTKQKLPEVAAKAGALLKEAYENYFTRRVEDSSVVLQTMHQVTDAEIETIKTLKQDLGASRFSFPALSEKTDHLLSVAENKQKLAGLMEKRSALEERIARSKKVRKGNAVGGIVTLGLGVVGGGLCGLFQYLAEAPYTQYQSAVLTADAETYRDQFQTMEIMSIVSASVGGASFGTSAILWATRPKEGAHTAELAEVNKQIAVIQGELQ